MPSYCVLYRVVRNKCSVLIEQWQKICILAERIMKRREAAAVRLLPSRPSSGHTFMPAHFSLPHFTSAPSNSTLNSTSDDGDTNSLANSFLSGLIQRPHAELNGQADLARLTNTLKVLVEVNDRCWRGDDCELCSGVRQGLGVVAQHTQRHADVLDDRVSTSALSFVPYKLIERQSRTMLYNTLEALKARKIVFH